MRDIHNKTTRKHTFFEWMHIFMAISIATLLPVFFITMKTVRTKPTLGVHSQCKLGVEILSPSLIKSAGIDLKKDHIALVTNQTGLDQQGTRNIDLLMSKGIPIRTIFVPQANGTTLIPGTLYTSTNKNGVAISIPITCMYKRAKKKRVINEQSLQKVDMFIFDMQDVGMRQYSYVNTLHDILETAAYLGKKIMILDRPNLLGGAMEGPLLDSPDLISTLAPLPIPVRYGMTIGELAHYINQNFLYNMANLMIVPMQNYKRNHPANELIGNLSPNIQTLRACHGYSLLGLLGEVGPFDIGVGTPKAFQIIALPESIKFTMQQWYEVRHILKYYGIESSFYRYFSKRKKQYCNGVQIHIADINSFSAISTLLSLLDLFKKSGLKLTFSPSFDKAMGTAKVRSFLAGRLERHVLEIEINNNVQQFFKQALSSFMYRPLPRVIET